MVKAGKAVYTSVAAAVVATLVAAPTASATRGLPQEVPPAVTAAGDEELVTVLSRPAHGGTAVDRLGDDLDVVAEVNDMTPGDLERLLLEDRSVWVHPTGLLYYVDPAPAGVEATDPPRAPYPYNQTFQLQSKPGSSRTIYLDFDGEHVAGTAWNNMNHYLVPARTHPAFDTNGNPDGFSQSEQDAIQSIWQRVSEDYAPFDVNVTTADPGLEALRRTTLSDLAFGTRALITPSTVAADAICGGGCGGFAFLGTFDATGSDYFQPAWVFPHLLGNDTKAIAEAISHEVGHNLDLEHDASTVAPYFGGHGAWAPIMGASYDRPISQWSSGEYADANNGEDDLAIITGNGLPLQADDHANSSTGATPLPLAGSTAPGLITDRTDQDWFALPQGCNGDVTVSVSPAPTSPNLDVRLRIITGAGTVVATNNPGSASATKDLATGMGASATVAADAGTPLFAEVDGVGAGNPLTNGYSDYASIGRFTISATDCGGEQPGLVAFAQPTHSAAEGSGQVLLTVVRTGDTSGPGSVDYARTAGSATPGSDFTLSPGTLDFLAGQTQKSIPVTIADDSVEEGDETVQVTLSNPSEGTTLGAVTVATLTITANDAPPKARPDLLISTRAARGYVGDGVYNETGAKQTKQLSATRGQTRSFYVEVTNDGATVQEITILGTKSQKGSVVTYVFGTTDLTSWLTGPGASVDLGPGDYTLVRVDLKIGRRTKIGSVKSARVTATSSDGVTDVVKAMVTVVKP